MDKSATDIRGGLIAGLVAYVIWGVLPVYFKFLDAVDPFEVLMHRVIWAVPFGAIILTARRQWPEVRRALRHRRMLGWLSLSAVLIAMNWFTYIWAIQDERIFESSLGYYINPLTNMLVGVLFFHERLRRMQSLAITFAATGVLVLAISGGQVPWIALFLAVSFTCYAVIRKKVIIGAMPGLFVETLLLLPFALSWMFWLVTSAQPAFTAGNASLTFWLLMAGPITALPLLCFALAARRLPLTMLGFMQFLSPTLQFGTGIYFGEALTPAHIVCFGFIWLAVIVFSIDTARANRRIPVSA